MVSAFIKDVKEFSNYMRKMERGVIKKFKAEYKLFMNIKTAIFWYMIGFYFAVYVDGDINHKLSFLMVFPTLLGIISTVVGIIKYMKERENTLLKSKLAMIFLAILPTIVIFLAYNRVGCLLGVG